MKIFAPMVIGYVFGTAGSSLYYLNGETAEAGAATALLPPTLQLVRLVNVRVHQHVATT